MTKTEENLKIAFAGEAQARNKYTYFARIAEKEGFIYIMKIFQETAENELQHAKNEFKLLNGINDTKTNLKHAIEGENYEHTQMYPKMQKEAENEGNKEAAKLFKEISEVEEHHEARYKKLLKMLEEGTLYKRKNEINWKCTQCGYIHRGKEPPKECPSCKHPYNFYQPECLCFSDECEICN
ncbi:rubrerythrin family protein [Candidatus Woesearchaeota archaeon]|nr:rubrerythrin family protein [Candidatus Woesearchaeota archaeon]